MSRRHLAFMIPGVAVERCVVRLHATADVDVYESVAAGDLVVLLEDCIVQEVRL